MRIRTLATFLGVAAWLAAAPAPASPAPEVSPDGPEAVRVYFTPDEALAEVFGAHAAVETVTWTPTDAQRARLEERLGTRLPEPAYVLHRGRRAGRDLGWALVLEEKGRFKPITFMVQVRPDGTVGQVLVMVYRESRGDGVRRQRFLKQFRGKDTDDRLRLNRDVVAITGATLSSRALAYGVRKALALVDVYREAAP